MPQRCVIISGEIFSPIEPIQKEDFIIACDKGYQYAVESNIVPHVIIGDFDSTRKPEHTSSELSVFPKEKDDTDTMLAMRYALEHGYREISIFCALGGRFDHSYANIQTAAFGVKRGAVVTIYDRNTTLYFMQNCSIKIPRCKDRSLSLFSLSDRCQDLSIEGVKYPLQSAEITSDFPIGISNEWTADTATIQVGNGILMVVLSAL